MNRESFLKATEFLVIVAFGIAYFLFDLHIATIVLVAAMTAFVCLVKLMGQHLTKLQLISWLAALILGGAAVLAKDESIIKWKPTVINSLVGLSFLITQIIGKKTLIERLTEEKVPAPSAMLRNVNFAAGIYFIFLAAVNIFVALNFSTTFWVNFKLFGITAMNISFLAACLFYLKDYLHEIFPPNAQKK